MQIIYQDFVKTLYSLIRIYPNIKIAVAVSGGADSLCLVLLLQKVIQEYSGNIIALVVDHQLREESGKEALKVVKILKQQQISSKILIWEHGIISSKLQENAREHRYRLLTSYTKQQQIPYLFLGHHFDDQLETLIMRKEKGYNLVGESAMSAKTIYQGIILIRPLLKYTKDVIKNTLEKFQQRIFIEDSSNSNKMFKRVIIRQKLAKLSQVEKNVLQHELFKNYQARVVLEQQFVDFFCKGVLIDKFAQCEIALQPFLELDLICQILVFSKLLSVCGGKNFSGSLRAIRTVITTLLDSNKKITLSNCLIFKKANIIYINRESRNLPPPILLNNHKNTIFWDNRFLITTNKQNENFYLQALGVKGYALLQRQDKNFKKKFLGKQLSYTQSISLPWLYNSKGEPLLVWQKEILTTNTIIFKTKHSILSEYFTYL